MLVVTWFPVSIEDKFHHSEKKNPKKKLKDEVIKPNEFLDYGEAVYFHIRFIQIMTQKH